MIHFKTGRRWLLGITTALVTIGANAQEDSNARDPKLKEGGLFQVKIVPGDKEIKIFLIGNKMAEVRLSDVGLQAFVRNGEKMKLVKAKNKGEYFSVEAIPESGSDLRLKLDYGGESQEVEIPLE